MAEAIGYKLEAPLGLKVSLEEAFIA